MSRQLTQQQQRRIQERQQSLVNGENFATVIANYGQTVLLRQQSGETVEAIPRQNLGSLVAGDIVHWQLDQGEAIVCYRQPRCSLLSRPDVYKKTKDIAANIDQMVIVAAVTPELIPYYLDKYMIAAELQGFDALLVVNKTDLADQQQQQVLERQIAVYQSLAYTVVFSSVHEAASLDNLKQHLRHKTSIFVGQSGVGKSALLNVLNGSKLAVEGAISHINRKGKHTTTTAMLYDLPGDIRIIDSPGIREFGLWDLSQQQILQGFRELQSILGHCQFRNCQHQNEPGCAVVKAHQTGIMSASRWQSYQRLLHHITDFSTR